MKFLVHSIMILFSYSRSPLHSTYCVERNSRESKNNRNAKSYERSSPLVEIQFEKHAYKVGHDTFHSIRSNG